MFNVIQSISRVLPLRARCFLYHCRDVLMRCVRASRYATGTLSANDAQRVMLDCERPAGWYPLLVLTVEDTLELALDDFANQPDLRRLIANGCARVGSKWQTHGDELWEAQRWAIDCAEQYAVGEGIDLTLREAEIAPSNLGGGAS